MNIEVPTFEEAADYVAAQEESPLHRFVYNWCPANKQDELDFYEQLERLIAYIEYDYKLEEQD